MKFDLKKPHVLFATWFGSGLLKPAPGTWGSIAALPFAVAIYFFSGTIGLICAIALVTVLGHWAAGEFEKETGIHDSKHVVIDEVAGQWIALIPGFLVYGLNPVLLILAFAFFRAFDIFKPWPVSYFDKKVDGPLGVMGDDIIAGFYAAICMAGLIYAGFS